MVKEIEILKVELQEREKSLPAHSIRPPQLIAIEELEEKIRTLQERVKELESPSGKEI